MSGCASSSASGSPTRPSPRSSRWQARELVAQARIVPPEHLHVTLAFLGSRPAAELPAIAGALGEAAAAARPFELERRALPRDAQRRHARPLATSPARRGRLAAACTSGWRSSACTGAEQRPWLPHVTVVRFRERPAAARRRCRSSARSLRPMLLLSFHVCTRPGRATRCSNRFR